MNKQKVIEYLKHLNEFKYITINGTDKKRLIFKNNQEVFDLFGGEDKVLTPFNDYTYEWLNSFLSNVIDLIGYEDFEDFDELNEKLTDGLIYEWVDSETDIYTSDLTRWLGDNNTNQYYLEESIKENPQADNHIQLAQYKAIEELFNNALSILIEDLKTEFPEED